jgi:lactate/malate dehydrogenase, alpha/beta C-terminal domain
VLQGSATLSMAYAGALFADACLRGLNGDSNVVEPTFVQSTVTELPFFASKVRLGPSGEHAQRLGPYLLRVCSPGPHTVLMPSCGWPEPHPAVLNAQARRRSMGWGSSTSTSRMASRYTSSACNP